jgi:oligopeptide transport system substrate-binding protein
MYWDAANVKLDQIEFVPLDDSTTMMNLYKAGAVDATYNHTVPNAWLDVLQNMKDYMDAPEMANEYYQINTTRPPLNDARVRRAFGMAIDREALAKYRHVKPLTAFVPEGIFPRYPAVHVATFDVEAAKKLLAQAGYKNKSGEYDPSTFPLDNVELTYNTSDSNRQVAEFVQAQWKQNLGLTVPLKNMEFKTFLSSRAALDYKGFARSGWIGDYVDPFSYLNIFYTPKGDNGTGWWDPKYVAMLDDANRTLDPQARYDKMAKAEELLLESQAVIPLVEQSTRWMKKPYVKGMYPNPGTMHAWKFVYIEHDRSKWDYGVPDMKP